MPLYTKKQDNENHVLIPTLLDTFAKIIGNHSSFKENGNKLSPKQPNLDR